MWIEDVDIVGVDSIRVGAVALDIIPGQGCLLWKVDDGDTNVGVVLDAMIRPNTGISADVQNMRGFGFKHMR